MAVQIRPHHLDRSTGLPLLFPKPTCQSQLPRKRSTLSLRRGAFTNLNHLKTFQQEADTTSIDIPLPALYPGAATMLKNPAPLVDNLFARTHFLPHNRSSSLSPKRTLLVPLLLLYPVHLE